MMTRMSVRSCMLLVVLCGIARVSCAAIEREHIILFDAVVDVHADATMAVTEKITVNSLGIEIKRGIRREFPTRYFHYGLSHTVGFDVVSVERDGAKEPYRLEDFANGKRLFIGDKNRMLPPGIYTYTITYTTYRQLGFFADHDELYWNVTGNGWPWFIEKARVRVVLPAGIAHDAIKLTGFTGYQGQREASYTAIIDNDGSCLFETTRPLRPMQGLTIAVSWPKGFITQPSAWQEIMWYMRDNGFLVVFLLGLLLLILFYCIVLVGARRARKPGTIIPLFQPPHGMSPAAVSVMNNFGYSNKTFAAQIVHLAVKGLLKIKYESYQYALINQKSLDAYGVTQDEKELLDALFKYDDTLLIGQDNRSIISLAVWRLKKQLFSAIEVPYIRNNRDKIVVGVVFSGMLLLVCALIWTVTLFASFWLVIWFAAFFAVNLGFGYYVPTYTPEGRNVQDEIDGFKLFLVTTETERLKVIGTPPTKTPELYETYLPYAMALGVEKQWSQQFAPIFKQLEQEGHPYVPLWYMGMQPFYFGNFGPKFTSSFASSIASATIAPGKSSGFGGGGSSGGGGGGGGGGGW